MKKTQKVEKKGVNIKTTNQVGDNNVGGKVASSPFKTTISINDLNELKALEIKLSDKAFDYTILKNHKDAFANLMLTKYGADKNKKYNINYQTGDVVEIV